MSSAYGPISVAALARTLSMYCSVFLFQDQLNRPSSVKFRRSIGVAVKLASMPLLFVSPKFCSTDPPNPVDAGSASGTSSSRMFLL